MCPVPSAPAPSAPRPARGGPGLAASARGSSSSAPGPSAPAAVPNAAPTLEALCRGLSSLVPLFVTALRVSATADWRDDLAVVESLGFVPVGGQGAPSALVAQLLSLLPIGGRVLRAGLVGALSAGICGAALYGIARRLLGLGARSPRLSPLLALAAALTATLSPTFQREATAAGGTTFAVALGLCALALDPGPKRAAPSSIVPAWAHGLLFGLVLSEQRLVAAVIALALAGSALLRGEVPSRRSAVVWTAAVSLVWAFCLLPLFVRPFAEHAWLHLGADLSAPDLTHELVASRRDPFAVWARDMGPLALGLGVLGMGYGAAKRRLRPLSACLVVFLAGALLANERAPTALAADPLGAVDLLAASALAVFAVLGVQTAVTLLARAGVPFSRPAGVLLVVFHMTLVFVAAERTSSVVTPDTGLGADVWTDEALSELPPNALVLVRSPALTLRLWASRVSRGTRPDVVVVPLALVGRGSVARRVLEQEPALGPLVRDVAMTGKTSEYGLAALADARPLYVELDPSWDQRLLAHIRPTPLWLGFVPHTLGRSDRASALVEGDGRRAFSRVLAAAHGSLAGGDADPATLSVLGARARERAVVLAALGDRDSARRVLSDLARIEPNSPFAVRLEQRLGEKARVELRELAE